MLANVNRTPIHLHLVTQHIDNNGNSRPQHNLPYSFPIGILKYKVINIRKNWKMKITYEKFCETLSLRIREIVSANCCH